MPSVPVKPNMIVYPSGALRAICLAATVPPAPARWSTMTCWPSASENLSAMIRAITTSRKGVHNRNWPDRIGLRQREARDGRQHGYVRSEPQKLPTVGKFHDDLPISSAIADYQRVTYTARALSLAHCPLLTLLRHRPMSAMAAGFRRDADMSSD